VILKDIGRARSFVMREHLSDVRTILLKAFIWS